MKTPEEIIQIYPALSTLDDRGNDIKKVALNLAFKEYAKQWVDRVIIDMYETHVIGTVDVYFKQIDAQ